MACTPAVYSAVCFFVIAPSPPPPPPPPASASAGRSRTATKIHAIRRQGAVMTASVATCGPRAGYQTCEDRLAFHAARTRPHLSAPPGEAPADIRRAWVGLTLPIVGRGPMTGFGSGVLTILELLWRLVTFRMQVHEGYAVDVATAID